MTWPANADPDNVLENTSIIIGSADPFGPPMGSITPCNAWAGSSVIVPSPSSAQLLGIFFPRRLGHFIRTLHAHLRSDEAKGVLPVYLGHRGGHLVQFRLRGWVEDLLPDALHV